MSARTSPNDFRMKSSTSSRQIQNLATRAQLLMKNMRANSISTIKTRPLAFLVLRAKQVLFVDCELFALGLERAWKTQLIVCLGTWLFFWQYRQTVSRYPHALCCEPLHHRASLAISSKHITCSNKFSGNILSICLVHASHYSLLQSFEFVLNQFVSNRLFFGLHKITAAQTNVTVFCCVDLEVTGACIELINDSWKHRLNVDWITIIKYSL